MVSVPYSFVDPTIVDLVQIDHIKRKNTNIHASNTQSRPFISI